MNESLAETEFHRRVQAAAIAYDVPQQQADELAMTIGKLPGWQQAPYVAAWTHATVLSLIERHAGCQQLGCPVCADLTDIIAMLLASDALRLTEALGPNSAFAHDPQALDRASRAAPNASGASTAGESASSVAVPPQRATDETADVRSSRRQPTVSADGARQPHGDGGLRLPDATSARRLAPATLALLGVLTLVVVASASLTAGFQAWQALPALGAESAAGRGVMAGLIALLPVTAVGWAFAPWRERRRWQRFIALGAAGLTLALDFAAWVVFASAEQLPYPWFAAAMFTFVHAAGPLTLIMFLQGWASRADKSE
ncbi:hypothetical protein GCM10010399_23070 [Dactylosporangium fulvum]|uniref:DUF2637 domain-containing protein n=1 Tax=Dactylosporangium fulvum TaxID=53359 RepID=A0ABY5VYD1_9ACTN|nr:hypothetical protein [Dactylosporangium fulvum]UWP82215.1 hypothetical protein Dfulv_45335 [Dactylosporangium fulvum]